MRPNFCIIIYIVKEITMGIFFKLGFAFLIISCGDSSFNPSPSGGEKTNETPQEGPRQDEQENQVDRQADDLQNQINPISTISADPSGDGLFRYDFYDQGLDSPAYQSARVYYPIPTEEYPGPFPATTTSGGFTNVKEDMYWFAERMASHGFIVIAFTPTNNASLNPNIWSTGHKGGITMLEEQALDSESPIFMQLDRNKLAISGFSMGGAGTILAANELGDKIKVAAPFHAFQPANATMRAATIFVSGSIDAVYSVQY